MVQASCPSAVLFPSHSGSGLAQVRSPSPVGLLADGQTETCAVAGGVVTDFDGDGMLDLILSHGESMAQPLSVFRGNQVCLDLGTHRALLGMLPWAWDEREQRSPGCLFDQSGRKWTSQGGSR